MNKEEDIPKKFWKKYINSNLIERQKLLEETNLRDINKVIIIFHQYDSRKNPCNITKILVYFWLSITCCYLNMHKSNYHIIVTGTDPDSAKGGIGVVLPGYITALQLAGFNYECIQIGRASCRERV